MMDSDRGREGKGREAGLLRGREAGEKYKTLTYFIVKKTEPNNVLQCYLTCI